MSAGDIRDHRIDDTSASLMAWEKWIETVRMYDVVRVAGRSGVVTSIADDFAWVRLDGRRDPEPFEWHLLSPYP